MLYKKHLIYIRENAGLSIDDVSDILGCSKKIIINFENGDFISPKLIIKLAQLYQVEPTFLLLKINEENIKFFPSCKEEIPQDGRIYYESSEEMYIIKNDIIFIKRIISKNKYTFLKGFLNQKNDEKALLEIMSFVYEKRYDDFYNNMLLIEDYTYCYKKYKISHTGLRYEKIIEKKLNCQKQIIDGNMFRQLRKYLHITQTNLSCCLECVQDRISEWENNKTFPNVRYFCNLLKLCNITVAELMDYNFEKCYFSDDVKIIEKDDIFHSLLLGITIQRYRELRGYSQTFMATQMGVSEKTFKRFENGYGKLPTVFELFKISSILDIDIDTILKPYMEGISIDNVREILGNSLTHIDKNEDI